MKISEASFAVIDTETTGLDAAKDHVIEVAVATVAEDSVRMAAQRLVRPPIPIPPTASAIHHLIDRDVASATVLDGVMLAVTPLATNHDVYAAHNAAFDSAFLPMLNARPWLCTQRLAKHVWPEAPAYNNQVLRYWLGLADLDLLGLAPHRAAADVIVTGHILLRAIESYIALGNEDDLDALLSLAASPITVAKMPFGKHFGLPIPEVPSDYIAWALRSLPDLDADLRYTLRRELDVRLGKVAR